MCKVHTYIAARNLEIYRRQHFSWFRLYFAKEYTRASQISCNQILKRPPNLYITQTLCLSIIIYIQKKKAKIILITLRICIDVKYGFENFFSSTPTRPVFSLFVVYIREIRGWTASIEWYTFSRTSYSLEKWQKKQFSSNLSHLSKRWSTQNFQKSN